MSGATSIAPIMTAVELMINPNVAIVQESITNKKKSKSGRGRLF